MFPIEKHITKQQIDTIVNKIKQQTNIYKANMERHENENLFSPAYASHRKQESVTWAIYSAFPDNSEFEGLRIRVHKYEGGYAQPELYNEKVVIHIRSGKASTDAKFLKEYYKMNKKINSADKIFCYIVFTYGKRLEKLELCIPNNSGKLIYKESIFEFPNLKIMSA